MKDRITSLVHRAVRLLPICLAAIFLALIFVASPRGTGAQNRSVEPDLTVHEWGTFTSSAGNNGQAVEWAPLNGTDLPGFVEHFGWAGFKAGLRGTVRMETPVLYFYSPRDLTLSVHMAFSRGLITEWYPHASYVSGSDGLTSASLYKKHADGSISWNSVHLEPGATAEFPREAQDNHYYAARETSAAPLRVIAPTGDQKEKFLFYRGVSAFAVPVSAQVTAGGGVLVRNLGQQEVSNTILFERQGDKVGYRIGGGLQNEMTVDPPELTASLDALYRVLEQILMARGLYRDEAQAMVKTWQSSWFEEGSRLLYIVPASFVDNILPLTINPAPANKVRVFVGRMELVSPATEKAVETALTSHDQASLQKYYRFLEPIVETIEARDPVKGNHLRELMEAPCNPEVAK